MNVTTRVPAFVGLLLLAFGGAALAGATIGPAGKQPAGEHGEGGSQPTGATQGHGGGHASVNGGPTAGGLAISEDGLSLEPARTFFGAGEPARFAFRITDVRGRALRDGYQLESEREMHLIVVRRDTATYEHLHPERGPDGTWAVDLGLAAPGTYRAYADFMIGGRQRTLATDLFVPGEFRPERLPAPRPTDSAEGFDVALEAPELRAGREGEVRFEVSREGRPLEKVEPYLGANGHLVALREGDLAYLHVHPEAGEARGGAADESHGGGEEERGAPHGSQIAFAATFPTPGRYRLFLQFKTGGKVRTVAYTLDVPR
ncbi:MAG: hypothetical protein ACR2LY_06855 [Thermoleophilaceae bacterium]